MSKSVLPSDPALLSALLEGLQMSRQRLDAQIASVRAAIAGESVVAEAAPVAAVAAPRKGKKGRKPGRPKGSKNAVKPAAATATAEVKEKTGRRKLSAAARKAIAAAQKRRWEEFRKNNPK